MKNVIIIYGGKSCEHDISIITACLARGYFANYNVHSVYMDKNNVAYLVKNDVTPAMHVTRKFCDKAVFLAGERALGVLKRNRIVKRIPVDAVVNCCHGRCGEDGTVAAICQLMDAPIIGSDITSSAVAMDKILSKQALGSLGLPVVKGFEVNKRTFDGLSELVKSYVYPLIVKPDTLGSSIGVAVCRDFDELSRELAAALKYDDRVLVEEALTDFVELNCAAMRVDGEVKCSRVDVPVTANDILTFADKYVSASGDNNIRPNVDDGVEQQVKLLTGRIYSELAFSGVIRVDYLYDNGKRKLYVNEINSIPGSLAYGLFSNDYSMTDYGDALIKQAERDHAERSRLATTFSSSVLSFGGAKCKKK